MIICKAGRQVSKPNGSRSGSLGPGPRHGPLAGQQQPEDFPHRLGCDRASSALAATI
jgi:hypothetical protein